MSAVQRVRDALDRVDQDAAGNAADYTEGDVREILAELADAEARARRAEDTLQDERVARAEAFRMHGAVVVEREHLARKLSEARTTVSRLELERVGVEQRLETAVAMRAELEESAAGLLAERDRIRQAHGDAEQRIAAAVPILEDVRAGRRDPVAVDRVIAALRGDE